MDRSRAEGLVVWWWICNVFELQAVAVACGHVVLGHKTWWWRWLCWPRCKTPGRRARHVTATLLICRTRRSCTHEAFLTESGSHMSTPGCRQANFLVRAQTLSLSRYAGTYACCKTR